MEPIPVPNLTHVMILTFLLIMCAHFVCHLYTEKKKLCVMLASNLTDELRKETDALREETDAIQKATEEYRKVIDASRRVIERLGKATEEYQKVIDVSQEVIERLCKTAEELRRVRAQTVGVGYLQLGIPRNILPAYRGSVEFRG